MDLFDTDDDIGASTVGRYSPERVHKLEDRIAELEAELQTAHEIGARHAKRVGEQAIELQALREAAEALVKSGFRVEREDFSTNVDSAKFDALQAALEGGDG
jgi:hypothetical protein